MTSDQPVQKNYLSLPRPFYPEVKAILRTCLTEVFFRKSTSPFSSSVVCVRKRDGGMRLCIDYRELNKKTVPDRHPIPRIQEALDSLGSNMLPPPMTGFTPPAVPMMFWMANTMMPYGIPYPAVLQLPQWEMPHQPFQYRQTITHVLHSCCLENLETKM